ncbi:MAG: aminopeptidase P family protein [Candidatus Cloacimonadales bacterium]|nr:aminopeptidase P family protein [Candidatus Cloacimonadales bacterium]
MNVKLLDQRRDNLTGQLQENEIIIIFAASQPDYPRYFLQDSNFMYFSGLDIPDAILVQRNFQGKTNSALFIERGILEMEVWEGKKLSQEEAQKISGIKNVSYLDEFNRKIGFFLNGVRNCYINLNVANLTAPLNKQQVFAKEIRAKYPAVQVDDAMQKISPLRAKKDKWEISQLQKAIDITGTGIESIREKAEAGMMEYELEAILVYEAKRKGLRHMGFHPIIASGVNAATLHYHQNNCKIGKNDLILLDVGAACHGYSADISRAFPVSGKFTNRQKDVYTEVLNINKAIIDMMKPGISMAELNKTTVELITEALFRLKLIKKKSEYFKYYMHSVGHHLGMAAHDVGPRDTPLEEGNVITVEPGIYIPKEKIGVRIEDDILVTKDGFKNLSSHIPKGVEELEDLD